MTLDTQGLHLLSQGNLPMLTELEVMGKCLDQSAAGMLANATWPLQAGCTCNAIFSMW